MNKLILMYNFVSLYISLYSFVWLCMTLNDSDLSCVKYDYVWFCINLCDYIWLCKNLFYFVWPSLTLYWAVWRFATLVRARKSIVSWYPAYQQSLDLAANFRLVVVPVSRYLTWKKQANGPASHQSIVNRNSQSVES